MRLALFDFDGTLTRRDSFIDFLLFSAGAWRALAIVPHACLYASGLIDNDRIKQTAIKRLFAGTPATHLERLGRQYAFYRLPRLLRPSAVSRLRQHRSDGDHVVVVSASLRSCLAPWCAAEGADLIACELEEQNGRLTGALAASCHGPAKAIRIRQKYDLARYEGIVAYGDSDGDREMLALASEPHWRHFKD